MVDRLDDHHARGTRIAQCVVMLVRNPQMSRQYVESVTGEIGPSSAGHPDAIQPESLDRRAPVNMAGGRKRSLVEIGVGNSDTTGKVPCDRGVDVAKIRMTDNMVRGDAVNPGVESVEFVARIDERLISEDLAAIAKSDDPDLTDAADPRAGCLDIDIDNDKIGKVGRPFSRVG